MQVQNTNYKQQKTIILCLLLAVSYMLAGSYNAFAERSDAARDTRDTQDNPVRQNTQHITFFFSIGSENFSRTAAIDGGNYVYADAGLFLLDNLMLSAKYSFELVPAAFHTNLFQSGLYYYYFTLYPGGSLNFSAGLSYLCDPWQFGTDYGSIGLELTFLDTGNTEPDLMLKFLPFTLLYNLRLGVFSFKYEFIKLGFKFPGS